GPEEVPIPIPSLKKLTGAIGLSLIVWQRATKLTKRGITVTVAAGEADIPADQPVIRFDRSATPLPQPGDALPVLGDVAKGNLARIDMTWPDRIVITAQTILVTIEMLPDPTIVAVVELVKQEAQQSMQQPRGGDA
ncbi:MAG: hypothetical protein JXA10_17335, partial [Anaerolineae bacterium]|nr:hypothetical protein [Anaerolineae bacterium]